MSKYTFELTEHDHQGLACIGKALGLRASDRGAKSRLIREALHFYAAKLAAPCCPDCGSDLHHTGDGRWVCPGCVA